MQSRFGVKMNSKQIKRKIENMRSRLKQKVDMKATGNRKIIMKPHEQILLDLMDHKKNPVLNKVKGIYDANIRIYLKIVNLTQQNFIVQFLGAEDCGVPVMEVNNDDEIHSRSGTPVDQSIDDIEVLVEAPQVEQTAASKTNKRVSKLPNLQEQQSEVLQQQKKFSSFKK